jgi:hypothetical protein
VFDGIVLMNRFFCEGGERLDGFPDGRAGESAVEVHGRFQPWQHVHATGTDHFREQPRIGSGGGTGRFG